MKQLNPIDLVQYLENTSESVLLLDVREPWEYEICHIENSVLIPMQQIPSAIETLDKLRETVVICHHGVRSYNTAIFLEHNGFTNVINLSGGIDAWAQSIDQNMAKY